MSDAFCPFQPQQTQEVMAGLNGAKDTWEKVKVALEGDWDWIMEEDSEQVRDNPEGE